MSDWITPNPITQYHYGFVYLITNLQTNKKYIGRKYLTKASTKTVKGKKKKIRVSSNWEEYYGSNKTLLEDVQTIGKEIFKREILHLCKTRSECSYYETKEIFQRDALLSEEYYNEWVSARIQANHLKHLWEQPDQPDQPVT